MSQDVRRPASEVRPIAEQLVDLLRPYAARIQIAGSLRRGKSDVGDVEVVAIPLVGDLDKGHVLMEITDQLLEEGVIEQARYGEKQTKRWGNRLRGMLYKGIKFELFMGDEDNYGFLSWLRTGPDSDADRANTTLVAAVKNKAPFKIADGYVWLEDQKLHIPTETDFFHLCGLPYFKPHERSKKEYSAYLNSKRHHWGDPARFLPGATRVVKFQDVAHLWSADHLTWLEPGYVYIGRYMPEPYLLPQSIWANPYKLDQDTDEERRRGQILYREHVTGMLDLMKQLESLRGKRLVCWCKGIHDPKRCHGDVLVELLEHPEIYEQKTVFDLGLMTELEWQAATGDTAGKSGSKKQQSKADELNPSLTKWVKPWLNADGRVWAYTGYGVFELLPADDPLTQMRMHVLNADPLLRASERKRLETQLAVKAATDRFALVEDIFSQAIDLLYQAVRA